LPSKALLSRSFNEVYREVVVGKKVINVVRGYFLNQLGHHSAWFYRELNRISIRIGTGLYLVPFERLGELEGLRRELMGRYEQYQEELRGFLLEGRIPEKAVKGGRERKFYTEYMDVVRDYLRKLGDSGIVMVPDIVGRVRIRLLPLRLDPVLWRELVEEEVRERREELLKMLEEEVERMRREAVESIKAEVRGELLELNRLVVKAIGQLRRRRWISDALRRRMLEALDHVEGDLIIDDPEMSRIIEAYRGLMGAMERRIPPTMKEVADKPLVPPEEMELEEVEVPKVRRREVEDYAEVFEVLASSEMRRIEEEGEEALDVDRRLLEALEGLSEVLRGD